MSLVWLIPSKGPFSVVVTPYQLSEGASLEERSSISLTGVIDSVDFRSKNILENVSGLTSRLSNYVVVENESSVVLVEILKRSGRNFLAEVAYGFRYAKVCLTRGEQSWEFLGVVESYDEKIRKGKCVGCLTLRQVDTGNENPKYF